MDRLRHLDFRRRHQEPDFVSLHAGGGLGAGGAPVGDGTGRGAGVASSGDGVGSGASGDGVGSGAGVASSGGGVGDGPLVGQRSQVLRQCL